MVLEIPKELKGKELTAYITGKLDELADNLCQDTEQLLALSKNGIMDSPLTVCAILY